MSTLFLFKKMPIFSQYIAGRKKSVIAKPIEEESKAAWPEQGYDCHVSAIPPHHTQSMHINFDQGQVRNAMFYYHVPIFINP